MASGLGFIQSTDCDAIGLSQHMLLFVLALFKLLASMKCGTFLIIWCVDVQFGLAAGLLAASEPGTVTPYCIAERSFV